MWMTIIFCIAVAWGLVRAGEALRDSWRNTRAAHVKGRRGRMDLADSAIAKGHATGSRGAGAATGRALGTSIGATRLHLHAMRVGFLDGWREGQTRGYQLRDRRSPTPAAPAIEAPETTQPEPETGPDTTPPTTTDTTSPVVPIAVPAAADAADNPDEEGTDTMTEPAATPAPQIETVTGGEVTSMGSLMAELKAIEDEATADLEDAQGDRERAARELEDAQADSARARADAQRVDTMVASLGNLGLDSASLGEVAALGDANAARLQAAQQRVEVAEQKAKAADARCTAAEQRRELAATAAKGVTDRHGAVYEAVQGSGVDMAERGFYNE